MDCCGFNDPRCRYFQVPSSKFQTPSSNHVRRLDALEFYLVASHGVDILLMRIFVRMLNLPPSVCSSLPLLPPVKCRSFHAAACISDKDQQDMGLELIKHRIWSTYCGTLYAASASTSMTTHPALLVVAYRAANQTTGLEPKGTWRGCLRSIPTVSTLS